MFNMNYLEPLKINEINLNQIYYLKIKEFQNKKIINIKYLINSDKSNKNKLINFVFQTPTLTNLNIINEDNELDILLESKSGNIENFINFITKLELKIKDDAKLYASRWFKNNNVENKFINFQKIIRGNNTLKIKLIKNNDFETIVQMNNENKIDFNCIPENSWCKMLLEFYAIWINSNNDFGIFFRPILISFSIKNVYNYKFLDNDSETEINSKEKKLSRQKKSNETSNNIFLKSKNHKHNKNNETSLLECNILYNTLIEHTISKPKVENNNEELTSDNNLSILNRNESISSTESESKNVESLISSLESLKLSNSSNE